MFLDLEVLPIPVSKLTACFYCKTPLPATAKEHIFNSSWGGSHKTGNLICSECNRCFSRQTDLAFAVYVNAIMNAWGFKGERHQEVPKIILDNKFFLDQGAKLKFKGPFVEDEILPDGSIKSNLTFNSKSQAKRWIEGGGMATLLGRPPLEEEQANLKKIIRETQLDITDAKPQLISTQLNLQDQYRSTAHTILKCLGFFLPEWLEGDLTKPIREFARYGQGNWRNFAIQTEQLVSIAEQATRTLGLGVQHNSVEIYWISSLKMMVGVLTILNHIKRAVVITQNYSGADSILYVVEDTHSSKKPPNSVFARFDLNQISVPLLGIQYFASPNTIYQYFHKELADLMGIYYPIDALMARLTQTIKRKNQKKLKLDHATLEEYLNLFLTFFLDLARVDGTSVDFSKAHSNLLKHGFARIANLHIGKFFTDPEVETIVALAFECTLKDFRAGMLGAGQ